MKWLGPGLVLVCALVIMARPLTAHPVPFSYLDVQVRPSAIDVSLVVHIFDVAHDLEITPMERLLESGVVAEREQAIRSLLVSRLALAVDGRPLSAEWSPPEILHDRQSLRLHLRYPIAAPPGTVAVSTVMFPYDPNHQTFVNVYERDELTSQVILDRAHARMEYFAGTRQGVLAVVRKFVPSGSSAVSCWIAVAGREHPPVAARGHVVYCCAQHYALASGAEYLEPSRAFH